MTHSGPLPPFGQQPNHNTSVPPAGEAAHSENSVNSIFAPQDDPRRPAVYASGDLYTMLATSPETNFAFNAFDFFAPPGGGPPPHIHGYEHEAFYVVNGPVNFFTGDEAGVPGTTKEAILEAMPAGTFIFGPRLRPHAFKNINSTASNSGTNQGARVLSLTTPGGLDLLFTYSGIPVVDRNQPIPPPPPGVDPRQLEFGLRAGGGIAFPGYVPATDLRYVVVLPKDASPDLTARVRTKLAGSTNASLWQFNERPKFNGAFGIEYTSLASFEETGGELAYSTFSLTPQAPSNFPAPVTSENYQALYVKNGQLTININGQNQVANPETFVSIAPGQSYSIGNFGNQPVEALAIAIPEFSRTILGSPGEDKLNSNGGDKVFGLDGNDVITSQRILGGNQLYGNRGNDILVAYQDDIVYGGKDDDIISTTSGKGNNRLEGQLGNDILVAGNGDTLVGGQGADEFRIASAARPTEENIIEDFQVGVDKISIKGISGVNSFRDLKLFTTADLRSTVIYTADQDLFRLENGQIAVLNPTPLATVVNVLFSSLTANDFLVA